VAVALGGGAVVLFVLLTTDAPAGPALWAVLAGAMALAVMAVAVAAVAARRAARSVDVRVEGIRRRVAEQEEERRAAEEQAGLSGAPGSGAPDVGISGPPLQDPAVADDVGRGAAGACPGRTGAAAGTPHVSVDAFDRLAEDLERTHRESLAALSRLGAGADSVEPTADERDRGTGVEHRIEVFVNVARRLQSLAHREIAVLDELEREIEDPDLLKGLFHVDHLATRVRRHAENLAVLGGAVSRRQWSEPVPLEEVLRSAVAEVEQYARVRVVPPVEGTLRGHAVADVIHLLAELVENATVFSPPHTRVAIRADAVAAGLAVEVEDRGLGMPAEERERMNALLADPASVDVAGLLADGRIGLYVVSQLARRHGVRVRLGGNIYGGVQAVLVLPQALLGPRPAELPPAAEDAPADPPPAAVRTDAGEWPLPEREPRPEERPEPAGPSVAARHGAGPDDTVRLVPPPATGPAGSSGFPGGPESEVSAAACPPPWDTASGAGTPAARVDEADVGGGPGTGGRVTAQNPSGAEPFGRNPVEHNPLGQNRLGRDALGGDPLGQEPRDGVPCAGAPAPLPPLGPHQVDGAPVAPPTPMTGGAPRFPGDARPAVEEAGSAVASGGPAASPFEGDGEHLDAGAAWPEPEPEAVATGGAPVPGESGEDSPARASRSGPGAMPEEWRQTARTVGETMPLVPPPRDGEYAAPRAEARAPLPTRERGARATPAGAWPPAAVDVTAPQTDGAVREARGAVTAPPGPATPPPLPRRQARSHLAPQLRGRSGARPERYAAEEETGHDPQLMAAFRRGVGLAEARGAEARGADFPDGSGDRENPSHPG
jgi:signal transduction histidine kinase